MQYPLTHTRPHLEIISSFQSASSIQDFACVLNFLEGRRLVYKDGTTELVHFLKRVKRFTASDLIDIIDHKDSHYEDFTIPKKKGGVRNISAPKGYLRVLLRDVATILLCFRQQASNLSCSHGFELNRSIRSNASVHIQPGVILNMDLEDFFPSISKESVLKALLSSPLNLRFEIAVPLAQLLTYKGRLPQGSPASPVVSNFAVLSLDESLKAWSSKHQIAYSRYADDLTFSHHSSIPISFTKELSEIIEQNGFKVATGKTRLLTRNKKQSVTGLIVNDKINVDRTYIRETRAMIHHWKSKGAWSAVEHFIKKNPSKQGLRLTNDPRARFLAILHGRVEFICSVRGKDDPTAMVLREAVMSIV